MRNLVTTLALCSAMLAHPARTEQLFDPAYDPVVEHPEYAPQTGPIVGVDTQHNNFHTIDGRYQGFYRPPLPRYVRHQPHRNLV